MVLQNQTPDLVARVQKPWPAWTLIEPKRAGIWVYLGAGATATIAAGVVALRGDAQTVHIAVPVLLASAAVMYIRAAQFYNYLYK